MCPIRDITDKSDRSRGKREPSSYLTDETKSMERQRRLAEQDGHRRLARVHAREHAEEEQQSSPEEAFENNMLQNPYLDSQRFDGVEIDPPLGSTARMEFDNQRREQEMEKQYRLGNMPTFSPKPEPR